MFWVWPVMGLAWAATSAARALFSR
jgi:hypothetical protein